MTDRRSAPFGAYAYGWAFWRAQASARRQAEARAETLEAARMTLCALAFAAVAYAWTVLLFCL